MIRKGTRDDLPQIDALFDEHFQYQKRHESYTISQRGIFPTIEGMTQAIDSGALFVCEEGGENLGHIVLDKNPPPEFSNIDWHIAAPAGSIAVIHMINVRPRVYRHGIARRFIEFAADWGREQGCVVLRSECGSQNLPAVLLFKHTGFERVGISSIKVNGVIQADGHIFFEKAL